MMIGRNMVDRMDEFLDAPAPSGRRYLRPPPLQLDAGRCPIAEETLSECTNTTLLDETIVVAPSIRSSNLTFGIPASCPARAESSCGSLSEASTRSTRYSVAEQALANTLKNTEEERSPLELQICALQQATATLIARAKESRERAMKLKLSLAEKDVEPDVYIALQHERWMEEKRQSLVDKEVEILTRHLERLKADRGLDPCKDEDRAPSPALNNEAKRSANLARFLECSPTRTSFNLDLKCRLALDQPFPRRTTMSDVSPLRLRPSSITPQPPRRLTMKHARSTSLVAEAFNPVKRPCRLRSGHSPPDFPPLTKSTESTKARSVSSRSASSLSFRLASEALSNGSDGRVNTHPSIPPLSVASEAPSSLLGMIEETGGMATIISHVTSRTRSEILADLDKDAVCVPDYAVNLLGEFDLIHDEFSLPDRELFLKSKEMRPIEVTPPLEVPRPSEESDTGPYTSFALPPLTAQGSWSHLSFQSPPSLSTAQTNRPSLQPLTPDSSSFSRSSSPSTPRPSQGSKDPRARHSLLFYMRKRRVDPTEYSPSSSSVRVESLSGNSPVSGGVASRKRFSFFSRK